MENNGNSKVEEKMESSVESPTDSQTELTQEVTEYDATEAEAEEEDGGFLSILTLSSDILNGMAFPADRLAPEERNPKFLGNDGQDVGQSLRLLQELFTYNVAEPDISYNPEALDKEGKIAISTHLLAAIATTIAPQHLRRLATRLISDVSHWVSRLFRYFDSTAFLHEDVREGVIRVCRMLLHSKYPKYATDGYEALYARPPVIYIGTAVRPGLPQHISSTLGLSSTCLRVVPCNTIVGSPVAMDISSLDRMMTEDMNAQKKPLLVIANVGGGVIGGVDNVSRIQELCLKHECWLHVEGHSLAALPLPKSSNLPAKVGDSLTLPIGMWLGVPSLPYVTLYRAVEAAAVHAAGLTSLSLQVRISSLPLWMTLQTLGQSGVTTRLQHAFELSQNLHRQLVPLDHIRLLSPSNCSSESQPSIEDLVSKPVSTAQLLDVASGTVVFQYVVDKKSQDCNSEYYDTLNSWLSQIICREIGCIPTELVHMDGTGLVLRWSTLEGPHTQQITNEHIDILVQFLKEQIEILNATVHHRERFHEMTQTSNNLQLIEVPGWAGLGCVRYLSDIYIGQDQLIENSKNELNALNQHLVNHLRNIDSAFSIGESADGINCVRFGMVTDGTDVDELLSLVISTGKEIESSSKFLSQMTEVVKKGIETATADLRRESEERLWQEGLLRHVPIVGSVYNWLSPPAPPAVKGRTLDLNAGVLESTENIYRYHMQVRHGQVSARSETKLPPAPSVVTTVTPSPSTPSHSRTSSHQEPETNPRGASKPKTPPIENGVDITR